VQVHGPANQACHLNAVDQTCQLQLHHPCQGGQLLLPPLVEANRHSAGRYDRCVGNMCTEVHLLGFQNAQEDQVRWRSASSSCCCCCCCCKKVLGLQLYEPVCPQHSRLSVAPLL
jgi:hypothetical protein